jgi:hypothetical protein
VCSYEEKGLHRLETLLESQVDARFDLCELYILRNVFNFQHELLPYAILLDDADTEPAEEREAEELMGKILNEHRLLEEQVTRAGDVNAAEERLDRRVEALKACKEQLVGWGLKGDEGGKLFSLKELRRFLSNFLHAVKPNFRRTCGCYCNTCPPFKPIPNASWLRNNCFHCCLLRPKRPTRSPGVLVKVIFHGRRGKSVSRMEGWTKSSEGWRTRGTRGMQRSVVCFAASTTAVSLCR